MTFTIRELEASTWRAPLDQIARLGGRLVEALPEVTAGREAHRRFLLSATVELFD